MILQHLNCIQLFWNIFGPEKPRQLDLQLSLLGILGMPSGQVGVSSPSARRWFKKLHGLIPRCPQFELLESSRARDGTRPQLRAQESVAELASGEAASEATEGSTVLRCQGPAG